jgi:hypothetical protein
MFFDDHVAMAIVHVKKEGSTYRILPSVKARNMEADNLAIG